MTFPTSCSGGCGTSANKPPPAAGAPERLLVFTRTRPRVSVVRKVRGSDARVQSRCMRCWFLIKYQLPMLARRCLDVVTFRFGYFTHCAHPVREKKDILTVTGSFGHMNDHPYEVVTPMAIRLSVRVQWSRCNLPSGILKQSLHTLKKNLATTRFVFFFGANSLKVGLTSVKVFPVQSCEFSLHGRDKLQRPVLFNSCGDLY